MRCKKIIIFLLLISIIIPNFMSPREVKAAINTYSAQYSGVFGDNFYLTVSLQRNKVTNSCSATLEITDLRNNKQIVNTTVSCSVDFRSDNYTFSVDFEYDIDFFFFTKTFRDATVIFDVTPLRGEAIAYIYADSFYMDTCNCKLTGTKDIFYNASFSYDESDMKMCMDLSETMYMGTYENTISYNIYNTASKYFNTELDEIVVKNYRYYNSKKDKFEQDEEKENAPYALLLRDNNDGSADLIVVIRGTYKNEWQGNTEVTGENYDRDMTRHYNFNLGKLSIEEPIKNYYTNYCSKYDNVNLIITGHSRGAAIANLYAKDATDVMNGTPNAGIPVFNKVTAYTFACPNVEKVTSNNSEAVMKSYSNIFNFWFTTDIVPTVPLSGGWNYWKYGKCYVMDISKLTNWSFSKSIGRFAFSIDGSLNSNIKNELFEAFYDWNTVFKYYDETLPIGSDGMFSTVIAKTHISLYDFLHSATAFMNVSNHADGYNALYNMYKCPELAPLIGFAISNLGTIATSHDYSTYNKFINSEHVSESAQFVPYTYSEALENYEQVETAIATMYLEETDDNEDATLECDFLEVQKLTTFANSNNNNDILGWDLTEPATWEGVKWDETGHVSEIDFTYKWLSGDLDCSGFAGLKKLITYANLITSIDLTGAVGLEELNCSFNDLSLSGLDLSSCTSLNTLYCDGCSLATLNLSGLTDLKVLSCAFNDLFALNIDDNELLNHISCPYNYLDVHKGGELYKQLQDFARKSSTYINYYPQRLPDTDFVDNNELQALKNFANYGDNNDALDWLADNGNISLDKVLNNVIFECDGTNYRIVDIDISELDVEGSLDLSAFTKLRYLYCNDTNISSLNISGCTELEIVDCSNSELTTLTLPTNIASDTSEVEYFDCENNHLDINIFTDAIVNNISDDGEIIYRHQLIDANVSDFYADDFNTMVSIAEQDDNMEYLEWDWNNPGYWDDVNWKYDASTGKYRLLDCNMGYHNISGDIDLSLCEMLELYSFAGTDITTIVLPGSDIPDEAFMYCDSLEAVIVSDGATAIGNKAFKNCTYLQAIYLPNSITTISNNAFENSKSLTIAGISNSNAQTYANSNNIAFEAGYFVCGNAIVRENNDNNFEYFYPVKGVNASCSTNSNIQNVEADEYGYFVIFGLNNGNYDFDVSHPYGNTVSISTTIQDTSIIITTPFSMINFDWCHDGYINAKDYALLLGQMNTPTEYAKNFDVNCDNVVNENDWMFASNFFVDSYINNEYYSQDTPMMLRTMPADNLVIAFEGNENMDGGWD